MKSRQLAQSIVLLFIGSLFLPLIASQSPSRKGFQSDSNLRWAIAKKAFDRFKREPTSLTAHDFYISISDHEGDNGDRTEILDHIFGSDDMMVTIGEYPIINIEMRQGNIYAARSAIKLIGFIDNGWRRPRHLRARVGILVGDSLGDLIRINPSVFLWACNEERNNPYIKTNGFPIGFISRLMTGIESRLSYELEMRRKALCSVDIIALRFVRDECIDTIDRALEISGLGSIDNAVREEPAFNDPKERIKYMIAEMKAKPNPENMKRIRDSFLNAPHGNAADIMRTIFPPIDFNTVPPFESFELILRESRCGNEYAIEILFNVLVHVFGLQSMEICSELSNLILTKPDLFIEKLSKYIKLLDSVNQIHFDDRIIPVFYFDWVCDYISGFDYPNPEECQNVILRRRIDVLAALDMPEYKELINRCIQVIEKKLK
jgi:hypothetical protein